MKEIDLKLETVEVKGGKTIPLTVRNVFYKGFWGKLRTRINWFLKGELTFQEYLDSPVTYERVLAEDIHTFHGIDAEAELTKLLNEEIKKVWDETPLGYHEMNDAYHIGNGFMVNEETWNKYLEEKVKNQNLTPLEYVIGNMKDIYDEMKKEKDD